MDPASRAGLDQRHTVRGVAHVVASCSCDGGLRLLTGFTCSATRREFLPRPLRSGLPTARATQLTCIQSDEHAPALETGSAERTDAHPTDAGDLENGLKRPKGGKSPYIFTGLQPGSSSGSYSRCAGSLTKRSDIPPLGRNSNLAPANSLATVNNGPTARRVSG